MYRAFSAVFFILRIAGSIIRNNDQDRQEIGVVETSDENGWLRYFCSE